MKQKTSKCLCHFLMLLAVLMLLAPISAKASEGTDKYPIYINDAEDLLTDAEEESLKAVMEPITEFGGVAFVTGRSSDGEASAKDHFREYFDHDSGTIFYIDMECRKICIFSDGKIYRSITKSRANEITNSVYRYASDEDYYTCAVKAFESIYSVLKGQYILRPMRYAHNLYVAIALSSIIMYIYVASSRSKYMSLSSYDGSKYIAGISEVQFFNLTTTLVKTEVHSEESSSDYGYDSGSSGGGGDTGGGGSSGF